MCLCWGFYSGTTSKAGKGMAQAAHNVILLQNLKIQVIKTQWKKIEGSWAFAEFKSQTIKGA